MPLYEFNCTNCMDEFEELVRSVAAIAEVKCPTCGSQDIHRKVSIFASKVSKGGISSAAAACAPTGT